MDGLRILTLEFVFNKVAGLGTLINSNWSFYWAFFIDVA